jgi:hypothetical protein
MPYVGESHHFGHDPVRGLAARPAGNVIVQETGAGRRSLVTANHYLAGVSGFCGHHA